MFKFCFLTQLCLVNREPYYHIWNDIFVIMWKKKTLLLNLVCKCKHRWLLWGEMDVYPFWSSLWSSKQNKSNSIIKGRLLIWGNECNDESVNDTMVQPFKLQFYGCSSCFFLAWNLNNIHPLGDLTSWNIKKKFVSYCLKQKYIEEKQHNETRISSQTNFLIIINHSKEYKDLWAFFKHFNDKENIFPLGCTNQMNSTQITMMGVNFCTFNLLQISGNNRLKMNG